MSCNIGDTYGRAEELLAFLLLRENLTKVTKVNLFNPMTRFARHASAARITMTRFARHKSGITDRPRNFSGAEEVKAPPST